MSGCQRAETVAGGEHEADQNHLPLDHVVVEADRLVVLREQNDVWEVACQPCRWEPSSLSELGPRLICVWRGSRLICGLRQRPSCGRRDAPFRSPLVPSQRRCGQNRNEEDQRRNYASRHLINRHLGLSATTKLTLSWTIQGLTYFCQS